MVRRDIESLCVATRVCDFDHGWSAHVNQALGVVEKANVIKVFCSSSWALAEPVAGLALEERFTERTRIFFN